ncbi:MAG TPA: hypothetical protein VJS91_11340 [Nitrososphaeraceae archaeon]|nr:hypothetical protein [Nitrososphaeraceae archaeon]
MGKFNLAIMLTIFLYAVLHVSFPHYSVSGQTDNTTASNTLNNIPKTGGSSNGTGIMHNTSGIIDDAFEALKDSFGSFFGK